MSVNTTPRDYATLVALGQRPRFEPSERLKQEAARRRPAPLNTYGDSTCITPRRL